MGFFEVAKQTKQYDCSTCGLHLKCKSPMMGVTGKGRKRILIISDKPGSAEDVSGIHLTGSAGAYLKQECKDIGFDIHKDCWSICAVNCRTPKDRDPTKQEIKSCEHTWKQAIKELQPDKILLLGITAVEAFLNGRTTNIGTISKWAGHTIPDQDYQCWVFPNYHPEEIANDKSNRALENRFYDILANMFDHDDLFPVYQPIIDCITDEKKAIKALEEILDVRPDLLSFDYETSGIKPHRKGHHIKTVSFSYDDSKAVAMPIFENNEWQRDLIEPILTDPKIKKTAHNIKFEEAWTRKIFGYKVKGWVWDSMIAAHIIDNRGGISSLKLQTYLNCGVLGYENDITPYTTGLKKGEDEKSGNRFNRIDEAPMDKLLLYNGLDAVYGLILTHRQQSIINTDRLLKRGFKLFFNGIKSYCDIEEIGWLVDEDHYDNAHKKILDADDQAMQDILDSDENKKWKKETGAGINPRSTDQLKQLFFDVMELKPIKKTKKGNASVDAEVLEKLSSKSVVASKLTLMRKNKTLLDKIAAFQRESINGVIHPSYNLHIARSYRSSCNDPNMQNNFKRDKEAKKLIREGVIARPGHYLLSRDYSGVEVSTACFYHKDPVMIAYVSDSTKDMHRDQACRIFLLSESEVMENKSTVRYYAKNQFVFPQFYGDYYVNNAKGLWESAKSCTLKSGLPLLDHLSDEGIKKYRDFEDHIKEEERVFWKDKFKVYTQWKENLWHQYQEDGFIDLLTGFRCTELLRKNEAINRPIQGTAFHLLLWSQIEVAKEIADWETSIIGQIHDDLLFDVAEKELDDLIKLTDEIETERIRKHWKWINVPLGVESEISELGGNWHNMEELK